jgi:hypothetical protein
MVNRLRKTLLVIGVLALAATGCIRGIAEESVRKSLPKLIGPAEKYEVHIEHTSDGRLLAGDIEDLTIIGHRIRTRDGLVINDLAVRMHGLKVDTGKKQIKSVERAVFDLDILQEDLSALARQKVHGVGNPVVLLATSGVSVVVPARLLRASLDSTLHGVLAVDDGRRIDFVPDRLTLVGIIPVPDLVLAAAISRINPLADLSALPVPVQIDMLTTDSGKMNVKGRLYVAPGASTAMPNPPPPPPPRPAAPSPSSSTAPWPSDTRW